MAGPTIGIGDGNLNLKNHKGHLKYDSHLLFPDGTFYGIVNVRGEFVIVPNTYPNPALRGIMIAYNGVQMGVWHGTGDYQGWTLVLEYEVINGVTPSTLTGYLLVP